MRLQCLLFTALLVFTKVVALHCEAHTHKIRFAGVAFRQHMTDEKAELTRALANARIALNLGLSPGGNLQTADEQSDAAYADLINSSMQQQGKSELSEEELQLLSRGGKMWEEGSKSKSNRKGLFGDVFNALKAVAGGAHIEKNEFGET